MSTIRKQIIELLEREIFDARGLSQSLGISEKEVYEHLPHIEKTVAAQGKHLKIIPSKCLNCGFTFKSRKRPDPPSRCPLCRSERIENPLFLVR